MIFALPYLILFTFLLYLYEISKDTYRNCNLYEKASLRDSNSFEKLAILSYLFFYGLRGFMFTDVFEYYDFFNSLGHNNLNLEFNEVAFDPGFVLCSYLCRALYPDYFFFQFVWTLIDVILLYCILKYETGKYFLLSFALLVPLFDGIQINLLRNIKGILLFFYAIRFIRERKFTKYSIFILIGTSFHLSTIILWPFYFFINRDLRKILFVVSIVSVVFYFTDLSFLNSMFILISASMGGKIEAVLTSYENSTVSAGFTLGFLYRFFLLVVLLSKYWTLKRHNLAMLNIAILYICANMAFNSILIMRDRFSALFALGIISILPFLNTSFSLKPAKKMFIFINMVCLFGFVYNPHKSTVAKYTNVITGVESKENAENRIGAYLINNERE